MVWYESTVQWHICLTFPTFLPLLDDWHLHCSHERDERVLDGGRPQLRWRGVGCGHFSSDVCVTSLIKFHFEQEWPVRNSVTLMSPYVFEIWEVKKIMVHNIVTFCYVLWLCLFVPCGLTLTWWGCYGLCPWHKPTELAHSFYSVLVSFPVFMALSVILQLMNSPDNSPLSHSVLSVLFLRSTMYLFVKFSLNGPSVGSCRYRSPIWWEHSA